MTQFKVKTPAYVPGFFNTMDRLFNDDFAFAQNFHPAVNIVEKDSNYEITLMAPGLNKSDFKISLDNNLLSVAYEKAEEKNEESEKFVKREFAIRSFKRTFTVNDKLDIENISAVYENGLLTVSVPKLEDKEVKAKTINVN